MVPIPMSVWPFFIAVIDVTSSGSDVPIATMVIPITVSDIPIPCAINTTFSIVRYPPRYRSPEPIAIILLLVEQMIFELPDLPLPASVLF